MAGKVLEGLFGSEVACTEVDLYRDPLGELTAEEAAAIHRAHPDRLLEYRAGRHCARVALARLGVHGVSIPRNEDRSPVWPDGFIGSITHSRTRERGWCAASVTHSSHARGIGLDGELAQPLERKLWPRILLDTEQAWLETRPAPERGDLAKVVFSAKEAIYKCQYLVTRTFLEFADVHVVLSPEDGSFDAELRRSAPPLDAGFAFHGRYAKRDGIIATAVLMR